MLVGQGFRGRRIVIVGACHPAGTLCAQHLAQIGARIVAIDTDGAGLQKLTHSCRARIEPLALKRDLGDALRKIGEVWGTAQLHGVLNLMPLQHPRDINGQIKVVTGLTRAFARALVAGKGTLVTVVGVPLDPLNGLALGMGPALSAVQTATAEELAPHGVRINTVLVPQEEAILAVAPALAFMCHDARAVTGQTIRLRSAAKRPV